ncbi:MAG: helix-turn-helix domain-containing protein [Akkermansiaceae bacterium]
MKEKVSALVKLGDNVRRLREIKEISQENLAFEAGLDRTYIGGVERGERNPTVLSSLKIAEALEVELSELLKGVSHA